MNAKTASARPSVVIDKGYLLHQTRARTRVALAIMVAMFSLLLGYFGLCVAFEAPLEAWVRSVSGLSSGQHVRGVIIMPSILLILAPFFVAARTFERTVAPCPHCSADLVRPLVRVRLSRCCPACGRAVLPGRSRPEAEARYVRLTIFRRSRRIAWVFPIVGGTLLLGIGTGLVTFPGQSQYATLAGLTGVYVCSTSWIRTRNRRFAWPLLASALVLAPGVLL
jgi:hypothetical protein